MKKALKIIGISLLIIILLLVLAPFVFQSQIKDIVRNYVNNNINANVEFTDVNLSFLSSFPQANVTIDDLKITNFKPFEGDTLALAKTISFDMSMKELFKETDDDPIVVNTIAINEASVIIKTNKDGINNYDIAKKDTINIATEGNTEANKFRFNIEDYTITNSAFEYIDEASKIDLQLSELNHSGNAIFTETVSELDTETDAKVSFTLDDTKYLNNNTVALDALIDLDLKENKYTFKDNKALVNNLPLAFKGYVQQLEKGQDIDLSFENPGASFKDFLAVIPEVYSKNISNVQTTGNFKVKGTIKGLNNDETFPKLDINMSSNKASFKYPDLPKTVENIVINASVKNTTGKVEDMFLDIKTLNFKIDEDEFKSSAVIKNLTGNQLVDANIDGVLNLGNITKAYPIELDNEFSGILKGNLTTHFDYNAIETNNYERIQNKGKVNVSDFVFSSEDIVNPINIKTADIDFDTQTQTVSLTNFDATTGKTDLKASGTINNLLGFLLSDKKLQGDFNVNSNAFLVSDFMVEGGAEQPINQSTEPQDALKIPAFLDCKINADAKTVFYDNLTLKDVKGEMLIKDEKATFNNVTSSLFDGNLALNGLVDTKTEKPTFKMDLGVSNFDISQSFNDLDMLQKLAPVAKAFEGKLNSAISVSGFLGEDFTPILNDISGDALAELLTTQINAKNVEVLNGLEGALSFVNFDQLDLKNLKTKLNFKNGKVNVDPFNLKYKDIDIVVNGSHGFDKSVNYNAVLQVPAKYLGSDINNLIAKIDDEATNNITIPVTATILGTLTSPKIATDLTSGVTKLTNQLIEIQKQKLINQGKDKLEDIINDVLGGNTSENDSTATETNNPIKDILGGVLGGGNNTPKDSTYTDNSEPKDPIKDILGGVLGGGNNTPKDSTNTDSVKPKDPIKDVLGGIFGKKKKKKDSVKD